MGIFETYFLKDCSKAFCEIVPRSAGSPEANQMVPLSNQRLTPSPGFVRGN